MINIKCVFNFHDWEALDVNHYDVTFKDKHQIGETHVLYKCKKCPKVKTEVLLGIWNLEQIRDGIAGYKRS
jgi:hypothetical protein